MLRILPIIPLAILMSTEREALASQSWEQKKCEIYGTAWQEAREFFGTGFREDFVERNQKFEGINSSVVVMVRAGASGTFLPVNSTSSTSGAQATECSWVR